MPQIPIRCLGRTETPPTWVNQTEFWWPAPTHRGPLTQSDPQRKGNQDFIHPPPPAAPDFCLLRPVGALWSPQWAQSLQAPGLCPGLCCQSADSGSLPAQTIPEAGMCCSRALCCILTHRHKLNASNFQACSVVLPVLVAQVCLMFTMTSTQTWK